MLRINLILIVHPCCTVLYPCCTVVHPCCTVVLPVVLLYTPVDLYLLLRELTQTIEDNARFLDGMLEQVLAQKKEVLHCKATVLVPNLL